MPTDRFLEEVRRSHKYVSYVDVIGVDLRQFRLPATDGEVSIDNTGETRRTCSISCVDPTGELTPRDRRAILAPYGSEIRPYRGIVFDDGTEEVIPLGVFRITKVDVKDSNAGSSDIKIEGHDLSRAISRDKFKTPYTIEEGTNILDAIKDIVEMTLPDVTYDAVSTTMTTSGPIVHEAGEDPWAAVTTLAQSIGCGIHFGPEGELQIAPPVDIGALPAPDFTYIEGESCTMLDLATSFTDEPGFNGVIVTGESVSDELPPVRGEAWDEDSASPTYRFGPYGEVPEFYTDQNVKTEEEAQVLAESRLSGYLGFSSQLSITATVNPALDAGHVVAVKRERSGVDGLYVLDSVKVPLGSGSQGLTLRQKRAVNDA